MNTKSGNYMHLAISTIFVSYAVSGFELAVATTGL